MILRLFFVLALVLTVAAVILATKLLPWCLLILVGLWVGMTLLGILFLFVCSLFCSTKKPLEKDSLFCRFLAYMTMDGILTLFRFRLFGEGMEKVPSEPCVIVCNHLSRFDPMVTFVLMPHRRLGFISKKENMRIPIVGPITQKIGFVPLDRENPLRAMRTIRHAARLVSEQGFTMGIYPEGTRSKEGELLEFKTGAFVMAKKAAAPLLVTSIQGTNAYKGRFPFRTTPVHFSVLEVIPPEKVAALTPEELSEKCRTLIQTALKEN